MHKHQPESLRSIDDEILRICSQGLSLADNTETDKDGLTTPVAASDAELQSQLDALVMKRDKKIENIGYVLLGQEAKIEEIDAEIKRLDQWKKRIANRKKSLAGYCVMEMLRTGIRKVTGKFIELTLNKSQPTGEYAKTPDGKPDFDRIDPRFVEEVVTEKVNTADAIRHYKNTGGKNGGEVPEGFRITDNRHYLKIQ